MQCQNLFVWKCDIFLHTTNNTLMYVSTPECPAKQDSAHVF